MKKGWILIGVGAVLILLAGYLLYQNLSGYASNWAYDMTGIRSVQDDGYDGDGVRIAIIDTGIDADHPSLDHIDVVAWKDYVGSKSAPYDDAGHGSHVAGIIAGDGTTFSGRLQGFDMKGVAPAVDLIIVKAIDSEGTGSSSNVANGIDFAIEKQADIICMSLGAQPNPLNIVTSEINGAVGRAINKGIVVVAAAGNTGPDSDDVETPADIEDVIAVGAVDEDKDVADFSARGNEFQNYGGGVPLAAPRKDPNKKPEILAPGVQIQSAWKDGGYVRADGTSQAAPFVCGAVALLLEAEPQLRSDNSANMVRRVKSGLMKSAERIPDQDNPHDPAAGYGLLQADDLLREF